MKILIVASGFTGATLPLANRFSQMGHEVKCFNFVQWQLNSIESIDFDTPKRIPNGIPRLLSKSNKLYKYLDESVDFYILPIWKRKRRMEKMLVGKIFTWLNSILEKKYAKCIVEEKADFIDLLIHNERDLVVADAIKKAGVPFCISYHEVLAGLTDNRMLLPVVRKSLKYETPLVLHSHNTANDLVDALGNVILRNRINIIHFGAFESYLSYGDGRCPEGLPEKYLLYLGHVHPYKGLKYLYGAVQLIGDKLEDVKIVVAGGGNDPVIDEMKKTARFVVYNHFIDNEELVGLIRHCQAIVCPYIAASQSGLVQTAMVYDKPVIATKVGAFTEIIRDGDNGILCEPANAKSLADTILRFINRDKPFSMFSTPDNLNWDIIADKYIDLIKNINKER